MQDKKVLTLLWDHYYSLEYAGGISLQFEYYFLKKYTLLEILK